MRKSIFWVITGTLCVLNFGANAATVRAGADQSVSASSRGAVSTRGATQTRATQPQSDSATVSPAVVSRAATKQKSVSAGTKVAAATENTAVPKECQDAFYGCMDAFCMLDNAAGGRCQCSDRITELDQALEDIMKLDEQTYLMATEGVDRIQMGEAENQVIARAKAAGEKVVVDEGQQRKSRTLDLSAWNGVALIDDDDVFDAFDSSDSISSFTDKKGNSLYTTSAKMCSAQISEQCQDYVSMLQLVYAQKVKSDCIAYENSLKVQKSQSQQKYQTAQKALRDAALTEYQNQNKYATVGECTIAFTQCMQTTAECGNDYTGCVTLAARENVRNNKSGTRAKQTKIKGAVSGADITLAASTLDQLLAKKVICESVTKQCVNANKNDAVWNSFLRNAAPALKSAELVAEQNLRSSCLPSLAECFRNACKAEFGENDANYDICLSNPATYKSLCKVQLEPCLEATGGTYDNPTASTLWNGLEALLNAMKVDACTAEVKSCITDRCGTDYSECIGLDTEYIALELCPYDKLTACMSDKKDRDTVREYVSQIAMGLALQIDNALVEACQNAVNDAMIRVCGDTESCETANFDLSSLAAIIKPMACKYNTPDGGDMTCYPNVTQFSDNEVYTLEYKINWSDEEAGLIDSITKIPLSGTISEVAANGRPIRRNNGYGVYATLVGRPGLSYISFDGNEFTADVSSLAEENANATNQVKDILNGALTRIMSSIKSDPKVQYCMTGRTVNGLKVLDNVDNPENTHFANLTNNMSSIVADNLLALLYEKNAELEDQFSEDLAKLDEQISERIASVASAKGVNKETQIDARNMELCTCDRTPHSLAEESDGKDRSNCKTATDKYRYVRDVKKNGENKYMSEPRNVGSRREVTDIIGKYNANTNVCVLETTKHNCVRWNGSRCRQYDSGTVISTSSVQMSMSD